MTPTNAVPDEAIIEAIENAMEENETLKAGGVRTVVIAARTGLDRSTVSKRCATLADEGELKVDWGFSATLRPKLGYRTEGED